MKKHTKVVVIDTGVDHALSTVYNINSGIEFYKNEEGEICSVNSALDDIGHGTAVSEILLNINPNVEIIPIKIVRNGIVSGEDLLIAALNYIYNYVSCDIINISAGVICCYDINSLYAICKKLYLNGVIIVASYDNEGAISYPACFDCVIGIDGLRNRLYPDQLIKISNSKSDFIGCIRETKTKYSGEECKVVSGNSFLSPRIVGQLSLEFDKRNGKFSFEEAISFLNSLSICSKKWDVVPENKIGFNINNAIVFPFNKEMHSIARYEDLLNFNVIDYYDIKYSGKVGKSVEELQSITGNKKIIKNYLNIDWDSDFDTVILGHSTEISNLLKMNFDTYFLQKCVKHKKNLFSCKSLINKPEEISKINYYSPDFNGSFVCKEERVRKMNVIGRPILGVVGTGSIQGKFTIQLELRKELIKRNVKVGQLGTEPTSLLFNMDEVYAMGHESSINISGFDAIYVINQMLRRIEQKEPDIIIFGSQAHTVPLFPSGAHYYPISQSELVLACQADAYILCVSSDAPYDYIDRCVKYLESVYESHVIAFAISPFSLSERWSAISNKKKLISNEEYIEIYNYLSSTYQKPVVSLSNDDMGAELANIIINYFS